MLHNVPYYFTGTRNQTRFLLSELSTGVRPLLPVTWMIEGPLDPNCLVAAVDDVVHGHDMLRARAFLRGEDCEVEILPQGHEVERHDLRGIDADDLEMRHRALIETAMETHDGMFRAMLVTLNSERHALTIIPHHSIIDGVSINEILRQIGLAYGADRSVRDTRPRDDDAALFGRIAVGESDSGDAAFWSDALRGITEQPAIAAATRSPDDGTGCSIHTIDTARHAAVRDLARRVGVRTFTVCLGIADIVLSRLTGGRDLAIAIQSAGRRDTEIAQTRVGMFSKALILRGAPVGTHYDAAQFRRLDAGISNALAHERLPYQDAIRLAGVAPRYAVNWFPPHSGLNLNGCQTHEEVLVPWPTTFDINLHFVRVGDGLELRVFHQLSQVDNKMAAHAGELFLALLDALVARGDGEASALASPGAQRVGNAAPIRRDYPRIERAVLDMAQIRGAAPAVEHAEGALSYDGLGDAVNALASLMPKDARVAVLGHRGPGIVVGALAALRAGSTFVLIDPCYPVETIRIMIEALAPERIVLCDPILTDCRVIAQLGRATDCDVPGIARIVDLGAPDAKGGSKDGADTAYHLFTSGSTGTPKCISSDHAPLMHALAWQTEAFGLGPSERVAFLAGIGHDPALRDIFLPLMLGATLVAPDPARLFEPGYLARWLVNERITLAHLTPSMVRLIDAGDNVRPCPALRRVFIGGEPVDADTLDALRRIAPDATIVNVYGASETPQIVVSKTVSEAAVPAPGTLIGRPRPDVAVHIVDDTGRTCGPFEPGEIRIETPYMSNGYLDADKTAAAFTFHDRAAALYRTGDMGFVDDRGDIVLIGRSDDQIKIRGYRIEPGDIEAALRKASGTKGCAVVLHRPSDEDRQQLVGFVTGGDDATGGALRERLLALLPGHMVPDRIVRLDVLPLLPNGKLDRRALARMPLPEIRPSESTAPRTQAERDMVALWQRVLRVSNIGIDDSLFDLGGDSLTAVRLMLEMERAGIDKSTARAIMDGATVRSISERTADDPPPSGTIESGPLLSRMSIHVTRGLLVMLLVAGHWFPGVAERVSALGGLEPFLAPLFNLATPGFALIFGVSVGYFMNEVMILRPDIFRNQIRLGALVLAGSMVAVSCIALLRKAINGFAIGGHEIAMSYYNVLGFYLLALLSVPLWLGVIARASRPFMTIVGLVGLYVVADQTVRYLFLPFEPTGLIQLVRLYVVAKFSYFNMSIGVLSGIGLGLAIRRRPAFPLDGRFVIGAAGLIILGLVWGLASGGLRELTSTSSRLEYWKWTLYSGVLCFAFYLIWPFVAGYGQRRGPAGSTLRVLAGVGVLALPFFVFHRMILDLKSLFDVMGLPDALGLLTVLSLFFVVGGWAVAKAWRTFYSPG